MLAWSAAVVLIAGMALPRTGADEEPVQVSVDCGRPSDRPLTLWEGANTTRRAVPPPDLPQRTEQEFGKPRITRCCLMLDDMWDYRTDEYHFNYEINRDRYAGDTTKVKCGVPGVPAGRRYYDYLDPIGRHGGHVMMNIRRYEPDVLKGTITIEKWKEVFRSAVRHYKQRCPNLRYIEVLNEPPARNQSWIRTLDNYYMFYRPAYQAVNEVNAELKPKLPLLVGGPACLRVGRVDALIEAFAKDTSPDKRLDFLSFHDYWISKTPAVVATWQPYVVRRLKSAGLRTDIPIFVSEIGLDPRADAAKTGQNLTQAAFMTACFYHARHARQLRLIPFVLWHSPRFQHLVHFDSRLRVAPFGAAAKMLRMHRQQEVAATSTGLDGSGMGLGALATMDAAGIVVHLWNYQDRAAIAEVAVRNVPEVLRSSKLRIRRHVIDSKHSNCFAAPDAPGGLEMVEEAQQAGGAEVRLSARLEPMALCLWRIEAAGKREPTPATDNR